MLESLNIPLSIGLPQPNEPNLQGSIIIKVLELDHVM